MKAISMGRRFLFFPSMVSSMAAVFGLLGCISSEEGDVSGRHNDLTSSMTTYQSSKTNEEEICPEGEPWMDRYRYLRALSLDLRGVIPTLEEFQSLENEEDVPQSLIDQWLNTQDYVDEVVRQHRALLWNNLSDLRLFANQAKLNREGDRYYRRVLASLYRGARVPCLDEAAAFDENGAIITREMDDGSMVEGWVEVHPYWAPEITIKVCAFDAQEALVSPQGIDCGTRAAYQESACGCGPDLRWCADSSIEQTLLAAFAEDVERRIAAVIGAHRPYTDLFYDRKAWVNGPIVYFYRYQTGVYRDVRLVPLPLRLEALPDLDYSDGETWVEIDLGEEHAGLLTSPAYLLRFMTNRSRANQFYNEFLCQPFEPPEGGLPSGEEVEPLLDLQVREGCDGCHAILEPAAAYWGRWTPSGAGYLSPDTFPPTRDDCVQCAANGGSACSEECERYYVYRAMSSEEDPYLGMLRAYEFRAEEHIDHIEEGPAMFVGLTISDNRLPSCIVSHAAEWLLGRPLPEGLDDELEMWTVDFVQSGFDYTALTRDIVLSSAYRRVQ